MTSPMPQIHSPQIILLVLCKQPIPSRIDILRPRHRKDVPSTCVREPPESCHDWNNLWRDFKSHRSDAQLSRSRIKTDVPPSIKPGPQAQLQSSKSNAPNTKSMNNKSLPATNSMQNQRPETMLWQDCSHKTCMQESRIIS